MSRTIVDTYVLEAAEILEGLEATLLELENSPDPNKVDEVFRGLHTVKGSGSMFGFEALARFTHHFESAFEMVRSGKLAIDRKLIDLALEARDRMAAFLALGGDGPEAEALAVEPATTAILSRLAELTGIADDDPDARDPAATPTPSDRRARRFEITFTPLPNALRNGMKPELLLAELAELGRLDVAYLTGAVPPLGGEASDESTLGYRLTLETEADRDAIDEVFIFASDSDLIVTELTAPDASVAEGPAAETATVAVAAPGAPAAARPQAENIRVPARRLDEMMDQLGELVIAQARLHQIAEGIGDPGLETIVEEVQRLVTSLRDSTLSIRMLPIETVFDKFRRVVRTLSAELGKDVELQVAGGETEVDKNVIDSLSEPLVHMIRNSMDHGVEAADIRLASGKPARGAVRLSARQEGGEVLIAIEDDGAGLDTDAIRARAIERGLIPKDASPSLAELHQMIFWPGFSTAKVLSSVSGRGVGMDAVKTTVDALRGSIDVASWPGRGSRVTLRLPVTLAIIDGLLVRLGQAVFVIPLSNVEECVELDAAESRRESGRTMLQIREHLVPFLDLDDAFSRTPSVEPRRRVVIVKADGARVGLVVDDILGQHQTVIKTLSAFHRHVEGFAGATILGDGTVALIIDVATLVRAANAQRGVLAPRLTAA